MITHKDAGTAAIIIGLCIGLTGAAGVAAGMDEAGELARYGLIIGACGGLVFGLSYLARVFWRRFRG